ncbi:acetyl-CoA synthetase [Sphingosinicella sp. BN140058]|nr:acetyl-CoA synthetase [Sphingosinicella sp. BN140058]
MAEDVRIVEAQIDGASWFGRLLPRKAGQDHGIVLLYQSPTATRT